MSLRLFFPYFLRKSWVQWCLVISLILEVSLWHSAKHVMVIFGLPYLTSVVLAFKFRPRGNKLKARISKQYKN